MISFYYSQMVADLTKISSQILEEESLPLVCF